MGQILAQGCMEAIKLFSYPQNLAGPKTPWENSVEVIFQCFQVPNSEYEVCLVPKVSSSTSEHAGFACW